MDFGALPPEINSARMYTGAGAGPMMAAAAAFSNLAAELGTTAASSQSVISGLTGSEWLGPSSAAMASATAPYVTWMETTAGQLQQAASQAMASAAAYETAFAMTVPPPVIAANRALLAALVASNILGQNTAAIAATEAQYGEMWAQDATAMYGYAASSAAAAKLPVVTAPAPTNTAAGQAAAVSGAGAGNTQAGLQGLISNVPSSMQSLASPLAASSSGAQATLPGLDDFFSNNLVEAVGNGVADTGAWNMMEGIATANVFNATVASSSASSSAATPDAALGAGLGGGVLAGSVSPVAPAAGAAGVGGIAETPVLAGVGGSSSVGGLSVPANWPPPMSTGTTVLEGSGMTVQPEAPASTAVPAGMPAMASAGRGGFGFSAPRYGIKPTVMQRPIGVG